VVIIPKADVGYEVMIFGQQKVEFYSWSDK
jgi:hypothetical protein